MKIEQIKEEKTCKNCRNCRGAYVCKQLDTPIDDRNPCDRYYPFPKPITVKELITILETLPQDNPVTVDSEGYFAVVGAHISEYINNTCVI